MQDSMYCKFRYLKLLSEAASVKWSMKHLHKNVVWKLNLTGLIEHHCKISLWQFLHLIRLLAIELYGSNKCIVTSWNLEVEWYNDKFLNFTIFFVII